MSIWEKIRAFANERVKAEYMTIHRYDLRCIICDTWASEVNGVAAHRPIDYGIWETQCCKCGQWTRWDDRNGMIVVLADTQPELRRIK